MYSAWARRLDDIGDSAIEEGACAACGNDTASSHCAACKVTKYCNAECQKLHWKTHKPRCGQLVQQALDNQLEWEDITKFAFEDDHANIKIYFTDLVGVDELPQENITLEVGSRSLHLRIRGLLLDGGGVVGGADGDDHSNGVRNLRFLAPELWGQVDATSTKIRVKRNKIVVTLKKCGDSMMNYSWEKLRRT